MDERIDPVVFRLGTKEYHLALTSPAARVFEKLTGIGVLDVNTHNWTQLITLMWVSATEHSPHLRLDALFEYASLKDLPAISEALVEVTKRAFPQIEDQPARAGEPRPLDT